MIRGYLIDTNIAIHARDGTESALDRLAETAGGVPLSALSAAELWRGIYKPTLPSGKPGCPCCCQA